MIYSSDNISFFQGICDCCGSTLTPHIGSKEGLWDYLLNYSDKGVFVIKKKEIIVCGRCVLEGRKLDYLVEQA